MRAYPNFYFIQKMSRSTSHFDLRSQSIGRYLSRVRLFELESIVNLDSSSCWKKIMNKICRWNKNFGVNWVVPVCWMVVLFLFFHSFIYSSELVWKAKRMWKVINLVKDVDEFTTMAVQLQWIMYLQRKKFCIITLIQPLWENFFVAHRGKSFIKSKPL